MATRKPISAEAQKRAADRSAAMKALRQSDPAAYKKQVSDTQAKAAAAKQRMAERKAAPKAAPKTAVKPTTKPASASTAARAPKSRDEIQANIKAMAERGWQRYLAKNPNATRAEYKSYAAGRVKEMAAKARAKKGKA